MVSQKKGMNSAPCLACDGTDYRHVLDAFDFASATKPFHIIECGCCGLARTEPSLSGDELAEYYKPAYYGGGTEKFVGVIEAYTVLADWCWAGTILSRWKTQKKGYPRVLDVGCGRGNLLRALSTRGCECHGVERKEFPNNPTSKQYQNYQGDIGEIGFDTGFFDVVILCHVLEHFENPVEALLELSRVLRHGGLLVLAVPNSSSLQARLFGADWFHLDLPRHTHHFTPDSLQACLGKTGFTVTSLHTFSLKQNPFGFIQSFENKVLCGHPNVLFSHLKQHARNRDVPSLVISFVLATLLLPIAILEYLISGMFGKGATLVVFAERDQ